MQQQQAAQQAQDPLVQMQQQELQIKQRAQQAQEQKDQAEIQIKQQQLEIEKMRIQTQAQTAMKTADLNALSKAADIHKEQHGRRMDHAFEIAHTAMEHTHKSDLQGEQLRAQAEQAKAATPKPKEKAK